VSLSPRPGARSSTTYTEDGGPQPAARAGFEKKGGARPPRPDWGPLHSKKKSGNKYLLPNINRHQGEKERSVRASRRWRIASSCVLHCGRKKKGKEGKGRFRGRISPSTTTKKRKEASQGKFFEAASFPSSPGEKPIASSKRRGKKGRGPESRTGEPASMGRCGPSIICEQRGREKGGSRAFDARHGLSGEIPQRDPGCP